MFDKLDVKQVYQITFGCACIPILTCTCLSACLSVRLSQLAYEQSTQPLHHNMVQANYMLILYNPMSYWFGPSVAFAPADQLGWATILGSISVCQVAVCQNGGLNGQ